MCHAPILGLPPAQHTHVLCVSSYLISADLILVLPFVNSGMTRSRKECSEADGPTHAGTGCMSTKELMSPQTPRDLPGRHWAPAGMLTLGSGIHVGSSSLSTGLLRRVVFILSHIKLVWLTEQEGTWLRPFSLLFGPEDSECLLFLLQQRAPGAWLLSVILQALGSTARTGLLLCDVSLSSRYWHFSRL